MNTPSSFCDARSEQLQLCRVAETDPASGDLDCVTTLQCSARGLFRAQTVRAHPPQCPAVDAVWVSPLRKLLSCGTGCHGLKLPQSLILRLPTGGYRKRGALQRPVRQPQAGYSRSLNAGTVVSAQRIRYAYGGSHVGNACGKLPQEAEGAGSIPATSIQRMAKKSCPVLEHKQDGMGKRLRSGPEMWVRVLNGQVSQRLLRNCVLRTPT